MIAGTMRQSEFVFFPHCCSIRSHATVYIDVHCVAPNPSRFPTLPTVAMCIAFLACGTPHRTMLAFRVASVVTWSHRVDDIVTQSTIRCTTVLVVRTRECDFGHAILIAKMHAKIERSSRTPPCLTTELIADARLEDREG